MKVDTRVQNGKASLLLWYNLSRVLLKFLLKALKWILIIGIGVLVLWGLAAFLGSLSVPTLLIIIILVLIFK